MPDLYRLTAEQLLELDGYGDLGPQCRRSDPAVEGPAVLARALRAQHPRRRLGDGAQLARHFGDVDRLLDASQEEIQEVDGIGRTGPRRSPGGSRTSRTAPSSPSCASSASASRSARRSVRSKAC